MKKLHVLAATGAALLLTVAAPLSASAHVTVSPNSAPAGSWTLVNVKVPNESATAVTTSVTLSLPTDTPFTSVSYVPVPGWTTTLVRETLPKPVTVGENSITEAVTTVTWTAAPGSEIAAGQLMVFPLSLGPVPEVGSIVLPAEQTYSDGTIVKWTETVADAEHPAPVLYVNDAAPSGHHGGATTDPDSEHAGEHDGEHADEGNAGAESASAYDPIARTFGIAGLLVAATGIVVAIAALRRKQGV